MGFYRDLMGFDRVFFWDLIGFLMGIFDRGCIGMLIVLRSLESDFGWP